MKTKATLIALCVSLMSCTSLLAQEKKQKVIIIDDDTEIRIEDSDDEDSERSITISNKGIQLNRGDDDDKTPKVHKKFHTGGHIDIGWNNFIDQTAYTTNQAGGSLLKASDGRNLNADDLGLQNGRSMNINFWPVWFSQDLIKHNVQLVSGLGFQIFNFKYDSPIKMLSKQEFDDLNSQTPSGTNSYYWTEFNNSGNNKFKNKLGLSYVSVPLMLRLNTAPKAEHNFFVSGGVIGSYLIKSWTKNQTGKFRGIQGIEDWSLQLTGEIGVEGLIKFYGTYALQTVYNNGIFRRPFAIGIRL